MDYESGLLKIGETSKQAKSVVDLVKRKKTRPYPACRPKAVAGRISKAEARKKTSSKKVKWSVTASGRKRKNG